MTQNLLNLHEYLADEDFKILQTLIFIHKNYWPQHKYDIKAPDLIITPDGKNPYLYRWDLSDNTDPATPRRYLHLQVGDDLNRHPHDHPWDNTSHILSGGYLEDVYNPDTGRFTIFAWEAGDIIVREASRAHRLTLPEDRKFTISLFTTGPRYRVWGFWYLDGWKPHYDIVKTKNGVSYNEGLLNKGEE